MQRPTLIGAGLTQSLPTFGGMQGALPVGRRAAFSSMFAHRNCLRPCRAPQLMRTALLHQLPSLRAALSLRGERFPARRLSRSMWMLPGPAGFCAGMLPLARPPRPLRTLGSSLAVLSRLWPLRVTLGARLALVAAVGERRRGKARGQQQGDYGPFHVTLSTEF